MDSIASVIGYGVLIFGAFWVLGQFFKQNELAKDTERYINGLHHELALRELYSSSTDEQDRNAIKAFAMGPGYSGWAFIVKTEAEYLEAMNRLEHTNYYNAALRKLKIEGSPFKLENHQVLPIKGDRHFFP
jgi:hypothetical protein